jgi:alpha-glucosidase
MEGGSRFVLVPTPVDRIPIYARGGAVIPMWPEAPASTAGYHPAAIELHLFVPDADGAYRSFLQEDDGLTFAALRGARYRTRFELTRRGNQVALRAEVDGEGYPEFAREAFHLVIHGATPGTVRLDGTEVQRTGAHFLVPNAGGGFTVTFKVPA